MKTAILFAGAIVMCGCIWGCGQTFWGEIAELSTAEPPPDPNVIITQYEGIRVKESSAADVLSGMVVPEYELTSQSKSVVASAGQIKKGRKRWMKLAAFDEEEVVVRRKYLVLANETPRYLFVSPWTGVLVDMEIVMESEVIDEPYANENARRIAILKRAREYAAADVLEVAADNRNIETCGLLMNQGLSSALTELASSPALAENMGTEEGMVFTDINMDKGRITLEAAEDVVKVKMRLGSYAKKKIVMPGDKY